MFMRLVSAYYKMNIFAHRTWNSITGSAASSYNSCFNVLVLCFI